MVNGSFARSELILGGQKSGKSRRAELLAQSWMRSDPGHEAALIATAAARSCASVSAWLPTSSRFAALGAPARSAAVVWLRQIVLTVLGAPDTSIT